MLYLLHLTSTVEFFRLQKDGTWRKCEYQSKMEPNDFSTNDPTIIISKQIVNVAQEINNKSYIIKREKEITPTKDDQLFYAARILRKDFPPIPTIERLKDVIRGGDNKHINVLIIDVNGDFKLKQAPPFDFTIKDPTVCVRHEAFAAGNDHVGKNAAESASLINSLYRDMLERWVTHLRTGKVDIFVDYSARKGTEALLEELKEMKKNWQSQY